MCRCDRRWRAFLAGSGKNFPQGPFDAAYGFIDGLQLLVAVLTVGQIHYRLQRIADVMVHQLDDLEFLDQGSLSAVLVEMHHQSQKRTHGDIVEPQRPSRRSKRAPESIDQYAEGEGDYRQSYAQNCFPVSRLSGRHEWPHREIIPPQ